MYIINLQMLIFDNTYKWIISYTMQFTFLVVTSTHASFSLFILSNNSYNIQFAILLVVVEITTHTHQRTQNNLNEIISFLFFMVRLAWSTTQNRKESFLHHHQLICSTSTFMVSNLVVIHPKTHNWIRRLTSIHVSIIKRRTKAWEMIPPWRIPFGRWNCGTHWWWPWRWW